jgi:TolA-binding protein
MSIELSLWALGGVAGLSLASTVAVAVKGLALQKRVESIAAQAPPVAFDSSALVAEMQALTDRVNSLDTTVAELRDERTRNQSVLSDANTRIADVRRELHALDSRLEDLRASGPAVPAMAGIERRKPRFQDEKATAAPINLNSRGQMLRMHRHGESVPAIASALGVSQGEVKLTIRMQDLFSDFSDKENSHDRL